VGAHISVFTCTVGANKYTCQTTCPLGAWFVAIETFRVLLGTL